MNAVFATVNPVYDATVYFDQLEEAWNERLERRATDIITGEHIEDDSCIDLDGEYTSSGSLFWWLCRKKPDADKYIAKSIFSIIEDKHCFTATEDMTCVFSSDIIKEGERYFDLCEGDASGIVSVEAIKAFLFLTKAPSYLGELIYELLKDYYTVKTPEDVW